MILARNAVPNPDRCLSPNYLCRNDSRHMCLPPTAVCDGKYDCPDKDDEDFLCQEKLCRDNTCQHLCFNRPTGFVCACNQGYTLNDDGITCKKANPCEFGACSQLCESHGSSKYCHCSAGYELLSDKFTCKSTAIDDPILIYTNRHDIRLVKKINQ